MCPWASISSFEGIVSVVPHWRQSDAGTAAQQGATGLGPTVVATPDIPPSAGGTRSRQSELRVCLRSDYAETIAEWIAAKRDRRVYSAFEFLFAFRASVQHVDQDALKIVDVEIDVNRRPVSLIATNVVRPLRRLGSRPFLNQTDLGAAAF